MLYTVWYTLYILYGISVSEQPSDIVLCITSNRLAHQQPNSSTSFPKPFVHRFGQLFFQRKNQNNGKRKERKNTVIVYNKKKHQPKNFKTSPRKVLVRTIPRLQSDMPAAPAAALSAAAAGPPLQSGAPAAEVAGRRRAG